MRFLLVNPFIYDFAAYDYWLKPLGLLYISAILKKRGHCVDLIDCMDRHHPRLPPSKSDSAGRGHFQSSEIKKKQILKKYPRRYKHYGLGKTKFKNLVAEVKTPDYIVISSGMTYWYPSLVDTVDILKKEFPQTEILIGGIYVTLCYNHAQKHLPECTLFKGAGLDGFLNYIGEPSLDFSKWPPPDYSFYDNEYVVFRTSLGCPGNCSYCGINKITSGFFCKNKEKIEAEINYLKSKCKTKRFVFYDDSLLRNEELMEFLSSSKTGKIDFYTPNGLEVSRLDKKTAKTLYLNNFRIPKLAADVLYNRQNKKSIKNNRNSMETAVKNLDKAGYKKSNISAYLIMGVPGQSLKEVQKSAEFLHNLKIKVELSEYGVVPGSKDENLLPSEIIREPLLHNNSIFPTFVLDRWTEIFELKNYVNRLNGKLQ